MIYTLDGEPFKRWVERIVNQRHEARREDQAIIQMDPEIAAIFQASTATSGKSSNHLARPHSTMSVLWSSAA